MPIVILVCLLILRILLMWVRRLDSAEPREAEPAQYGQSLVLLKWLGAGVVSLLLIGLFVYLHPTKREDAIRDKVALVSSVLDVKFSTEKNELSVSVVPSPDKENLDYFQDFLAMTQRIPEENFNKVALVSQGKPLFWISGQDFLEVARRSKGVSGAFSLVTLYSDFPSYLRAWNKDEPLSTDRTGQNILEANKLMSQWTGAKK